LEGQEGAPPFEVVVVDDASPDDTTAVAEAFAQQSSLPVRVLRRATNGGPAAARNDGWRSTTAPYVAFIDDDCTAASTWVTAVYAGLASGASIVQGHTRPDPVQHAGRGPFTRSLHTVTEDGWYPTCNIGYRAAALRTAGGFDEVLRYGEDTDLAWRVRGHGGRATFAPDALAHHDVRSEGYREHLHDLRRHTGVVSVVRRHPQLRTLLPHPYVLDRSHPLALLAAGGLVVSALRRRPGPLLLVAPWVRHRALADPPFGRRRWWPVVLPMLLVRDLVATGYMVDASLRERSVVL
jgi:GT2 family glycosyltransferase